MGARSYRLIALVPVIVPCLDRYVDAGGVEVDHAQQLRMAVLLPGLKNGT